MKYKYSIIDQSTCYQGFMQISKYHLDIEKYQDGFLQGIVRECGRLHDVVAVILYDPEKDLFLLVEQFRIGLMVRGEAKPWSKEIVAGFVDPNESIETTAIRETKEETGCDIKELKPLFNYYPSPGGSAAKVHTFLGIIDANQYQKYTGVTEEGEDIKVLLLSSNDIKQQIKNGQINTATSILAFQSFFNQSFI